MMYLKASIRFLSTIYYSFLFMITVDDSVLNSNHHLFFWKAIAEIFFTHFRRILSTFFYFLILCFL